MIPSGQNDFVTFGKNCDEIEEEHPQKTNQILYRFMADELDFQILLELTYRADILSLYEMQALDQEEFRVMISNSESLHSQIYTLQNKRSNITK